MKKYFVIDIGSNTVKYSAYKLFPDGRYEKSAHRSETVRFIHYVRDGIVSEEGITALCATLGRFQSEADELRVPRKNRFVFATASFRRLRDPAAVIDEVERRVGLRIDLISGEDEAELSFRGMLSTLDPCPSCGVMLDMGGGSTEVTGFQSKASGVAREFSVSNPFGSLSLQEQFVAGEYPTPAEAEALRAFVRATVSLPEKRYLDTDGDKTVHCFAVGGSAKAICTLLGIREGFEFTPGPTPIPAALFRRQIADYLAGNDLAEMKARYPERYRVLIPALLAYDEIWQMVGADFIHVPDGGMRDGYFVGRLLGR